MSTYCKDYCLKLFRRHAQDLFLSFVLFFITLYFVAINSPLALGIACFSLILMIFLRRNQKAFSQSQIKARNIESLLLPLSPKELFYVEFLRTCLTFLPVYILSMSLTCIFLADGKKLSLFNIIPWGFLIVVGLIVVGTVTSLKMPFQKEKWIHKITSMARFCNYFLLAALVVLIGQFLKSEAGKITFFTIALLMLISYLSHSMEKKFLNEHKVFSDKNFKWFDIPGTLILLFTLVSFFLRSN